MFHRWGFNDRPNTLSSDLAPGLTIPAIPFVKGLERPRSHCCLSLIHLRRSQARCIRNDDIAVAWPDTHSSALHCPISH